MSHDTARSAEAARPAPLCFDAVIFDMDGVVTRTAELHAAAWKELFDDFLRAWVAGGRAAFRPFDPGADYLSYVDGRPRHEGVRGFLAARGVQLAEGSSADGRQALTVHGLATHKGALFVQRMRRDGVAVFASTIALVQCLRARGVRTAVVTSSRNGREVLRLSGVEELFDVRIDGIDAAALALQGKPHPDPFLRAARLLDVPPGRAIVIEDAISGVEAGRRGGFGLVVGVDRGGNREALAAHGADLVVLRRGILHGFTEYEPDVDRRVVVRTRRCASLADLHLLLQEVSVCLANYSGTVELDAAMDDPDLAGNHPHLSPLPAGGADAALEIKRFTTQASGVEICICRHRRSRVPDPPGSPGTRDPPGGARTVLRLVRDTARHARTRLRSRR